MHRAFLPHRYFTSDLVQDCKDAAKRDIPLLIERDAAYRLLVAQGFRCALSGLEISITRRTHRGKSDNTASLDRIDSGKPYEEGNLQWLHKDVNKMKFDLPQARFLELCRLVVRTNK